MHMLLQLLIPQDLEFVVQNQADKKHKISLLRKVSGTLYPGLMSALMGPSGSGKTTLLGTALFVSQVCPLPQSSHVYLCPISEYD